MAEEIKVPAGVYDMVTRCMEQEFPDNVAIRYVAADGKTLIPGVNVMPKLARNPGRIWRGAPNVGMDNEDILSQLGYSDGEIKEMYEQGILDRKEYFEP